MTIGAAATALLLGAAPASAQLPGVDDVIDSANDAVGDTVKDVGDTVKDTTGPIDEVVDEVKDTVEDVGGTVGDTVEDVGGTVGDTVGGTGGKVIKDVTGDAGDAISETTKDVTGTTGETIGVVDDVVGGTSVQNPGHDDLGSGPSGGETRDGGSTSLTNGDSSRNEQTGGATSFDERSDPAASHVGPDSLRDFAQGVIEQAARFAFPLALALLVAAFLAIQNRLDSRDPRLAHAVMDPFDDHLSFS